MVRFRGVGTPAKPDTFLCGEVGTRVWGGQEAIYSFTCSPTDPWPKRKPLGCL